MPQRFKKRPIMFAMLFTVLFAAAGAAGAAEGSAVGLGLAATAGLTGRGPTSARSAPRNSTRRLFVPAGGLKRTSRRISAPPSNGTTSTSPSSPGSISGIAAPTGTISKSAVTKDVPPGQVYYGMPAQPVKKTLRNYSLINRIAEMRKQIKVLQEAVAELSEMAGGDDR